MKKFCETRTHFGELEENYINILYNAKNDVSLKRFLPGLHYISAYMCVKWQVSRKMLRMRNHVDK